MGRTWQWVRRSKQAAAFLAGSHRTIYGILALGVLPAMFVMLGKQTPFRRLTLIGLTLVTVALLFVLPVNVSPVTSTLSDQTTTYDVQVKLVSVPLRLLRAVVGPFPWRQIVDFPDGYEYMPEAFLVSCLNLAIFVASFRLALYTIRNRLPLDPLFGAGVCFLACALLSYGVHVTYVVVGTFFMIPLALSDMNFFKRALGWSFSGFIIANIVYYISGLEGSGLVQGLTGY